MGRAVGQSKQDDDFLDAVRAGDCEAAQKHLSLGAKINTHGADEKTALLIAAEKGDSRIVTMLLQNKAARDWQDADGNTALLLSLRNGRTDASLMLLSENFNTAATSNKGENVMTLAAKGNLCIVFAKLAATGLDVDLRDKQQHTPLMHAIHADMAGASVPMILSMKADINARDEDGRTPLMHAVLAGKGDIVKTLLLAGAKSNLTDKRGMSALDHAASWHKDALVTELKNAFLKYDVPQFSSGTKQPVKPLHVARFRPESARPLV
ncbi:MAG: ankyrin repeat domain-containing protein [Micavibrio sp.]|nr:ankyrin repeat domain-containing protein [Micavibrio sp.]